MLLPIVLKGRQMTYVTRISVSQC